MVRSSIRSVNERGRPEFASRLARRRPTCGSLLYQIQPMFLVRSRPIRSVNFYCRRILHGHAGLLESLEWISITGLDGSILRKLFRRNLK